MMNQTAFPEADVLAGLRAGLASFDLPVDPDRLAGRLALYLAELHKWNRAYNLTAVRDPLEMLPKHIFDSLTALPFAVGENIADAGTGAGLPGIPLALCYPQKRFTLLDSNGKKTRFVERVARQLQLTNVDVMQTRAEAYQPDALFDTVLCRAFTSLASFVERCAGMLAADGRLVAMKGRYPEDEVAELPSGWQVEHSEPVSVHGLDGERHIVVLTHM